MNTNVLSDSELPMAFETRCTITCAPYPIAVHSTLLPDLAASSSVVACSTGIPAYTIISPHRQPVDTDFGIGHIYIYIATSNKFTNAMTHHWIRGRANNATTWARRRVDAYTRHVLNDVSWSIVHPREPATNLHDQICPNEAGLRDRWRGESVELSRRARTFSRRAHRGSHICPMRIRTTLGCRGYKA